MRTGFKRLNDAFGVVNTATKYAPIHNVINKVRMLNISHKSSRMGCLGGGGFADHPVHYPNPHTDAQGAIHRHCHVY